jgi:hypothetical protein
MVLGFVHLNLVKCFTFDRSSLFWPLGLRKVGCLDMDLCLGTLFEIAPPLEVVITLTNFAIFGIVLASQGC